MAINLGPRDRIKTLPKVNRRALRKYGEFWRALQLVGDALSDAEKVAAKAADGGKGKRSKGATAKAGGDGAHWSVASPDEIAGSAKKAHGSLRVMAASAKKWEAELISREWRK